MSRNTNTISIEALLLFFNSLLLYSRAGLTLSQTFERLLLQYKNQTLLIVIKQLTHDIHHGFTLAQAVKNQPHIFSPFICHLIYVGENSGHLEKVNAAIIVHLQYWQHFKKKLRQQLFYPVAILVIAGVIFCGICMFIIPQFQVLFLGSNIELPWLTQIIFSFANIINYSHALSFAILMAAVASIFFQRQYIANKVMTVLQRLPYFRHLLQHFATLHLLQQLAQSLSAGILLSDALTLCLPQHIPMLKRILQKAKYKVQNGHMLYQAVMQSDYFPEDILQLIRLGEESGNLAVMLKHAADILQQRLLAQVEKLCLLLEPLIMLVLGVLIGGLISGIYLPLFNLGNTFS